MRFWLWSLAPHKLDVVAHTCDYSSWEVEVGVSNVQGYLGLLSKLEPIWSERRGEEKGDRVIYIARVVCNEAES